MKNKAAILTIALLLAFSSVLSAQTADNQNESTGKTKHGTYIKGGLAHWQENIFGPNFLTDWQGNLFGSDYDLTSINIEVETYFNGTRLQLSGWSAGYRKDGIRYTDFGHMFYGRAFRSFNLKVLELKPSGGVEWGMPSLNFDKTTFGNLRRRPFRYEHSYPAKNSNVPFVGTAKDGTIYPFAELSLVQRPGIFLIEGGMRINIMKFGIDNYSVRYDDVITFNSSEKRMLVPYLFVNIGVKMF